MSTQYADLFAALAAPFEAGEIRNRTQAGRTLYYITARTAMNRLDDVLGPENWWDHYEAAENSVKCVLTIRLADGSCLAKQDAGGYAGMADSGDDDKSGYSDAFKRAAVKFGVGRYLYRDGVPNFVREREPGVAHPTPAHQPDPPSQARPSATTDPSSPLRQPPSDTNGHPDHGQRPGARDSAPKSGRALFAWTKEQETRFEVGLLKYLNSWSKLQEFPGRMVDWDAEQVALAYAEAVRKLQTIATAGADAFDEALAN